MPGSGHHVRAVLARRDFRRLFATRLGAQMADGIFQAGLAGTILFNPDRHTSAVAIAVGFAVLLLPYSFVGPFAGVLLDKWSRRHVLLAANVVRMALTPAVAALIWFGVDSVALLPLALIAIGVQRFFNSGLGAALPHVTDEKQLITANSFAGTAGAMAFTAGITSAVALRPLVGAGDHGYAAIALVSVVGYFASAWIVARFDARALGPDHVAKHHQLGVTVAIATAARGMAAGARHLVARPRAGYALLAISGARICYGVALMAILLLYRNYFSGTSGFFRAGEVGMGQIVMATAGGTLLAAVFTPAMTRRIGPARWLGGLLCFAAVADAVLTSPYQLPTLVAASFFTAFAAQGGKLVCETSLQRDCDDDYRGRVFSVLDTVYNSCMVLGLFIGALTLPATGKSYAVLFSVCVVYILLGAGYLLATRTLRTPSHIPAKLPAPVPAVRKASHAPVPEAVR